MSTPQHGYQSPATPGKMPELPTGPAEPHDHSACLPEVITLQPGQRALLVYKRDLTHEEAHTISRLLAERYPNNEITVASADSIIVLPPQEPA